MVTAHAYLTVTVDRLALRTIMNAAAPKGYGDLGFDTAISGPVKVEWGGPATDIADTVQVQADLKLSPTGSKRSRDIPVSGQVLGHYDGGREVVNVTSLALNTPQSSLKASGVLGVNQGDPLTSMNVDLAVRNFAEYDQLLTSLGLTGNGKKGAQAIPIDLHGSAQFHGTARGALAKLDVKGHLEANNLEVRTGDFAAALARTRNRRQRQSEPANGRRHFSHAAQAGCSRCGHHRHPHRLARRRRGVHPAGSCGRQFHHHPGLFGAAYRRLVQAPYRGQTPRRHLRLG